MAVFSNDGKSSTEGPAAGSYQKTRTQAGAHLVINEIRLVSTFCLCQMYMRDSLHQVDHGIIIHVMRATMSLFWWATHTRGYNVQ